MIILSYIFTATAVARLDTEFKLAPVIQSWFGEQLLFKPISAACTASHLSSRDETIHGIGITRTRRGKIFTLLLRKLKSQNMSGRGVCFF